MTRKSFRRRQSRVTKSPPCWERKQVGHSKQRASSQLRQQTCICHKTSSSVLKAQTQPMWVGSLYLLAAGPGKALCLCSQPWFPRGQDVMIQRV